MNKSFIMNALIIVLLIIVGLILLKFLTQLVILVVIIGGAYLLYRLYLKNKRKRWSIQLKNFIFLNRTNLDFHEGFSYCLVKIVNSWINFHKYYLYLIYYYYDISKKRWKLWMFYTKSDFDCNPIEIDFSRRRIHFSCHINNL